MPGIGGGGIVAPGTPYNGMTVMAALGLAGQKAKNGDPTDLKMLQGLPQFKGIGWQGLLAMAGIMTGGAIAAGLTGAGAGGAATSGNLGAIAGGYVPELPTLPGSVFPSAAGALGATAPSITAGAAAGGGILGTGLTTGQLINTGLGALGGVLGNTVGARTGTSATTIAPAYQGLADLLRARALSRLQQSTDLGGYTANGISNINDSFKNAMTNENANLTARGLAGSPVAGAITAKANTARAGDIASFMNSIPLLQRQLQDQDMANASTQVANFGVGHSSVAPGSAVAGGFTSAAELLAYLRGKQGVGAAPGGLV